MISFSAACVFQDALSATETKAQEVQALKDGKLGKEMKSASLACENLSKELVQVTSEMENKKTALSAEVAALEAMIKV